ncbi:hypothetical protein [Propionivibrio sp.]|uniref:hypothetical protein n=1 Tax=Propionivibrio sp. TaxID=2212460 RepID=UPI003BEFD334
MDCIDAERPRRSDDGTRVTLSAAPRTFLGLSLPHRIDWDLRVPACFQDILIQSGGAQVVSEDLDWVGFRLEGADSRLDCCATRMGRLELVGAGQRAQLRVQCLESVLLDGVYQKAVITHGDDYALEGQAGGAGCRIEAPEASPSAGHRLRYQLNGLNNSLEIRHGARRIR